MSEWISVYRNPLCQRFSIENLLPLPPPLPPSSRCNETGRAVRKIKQASALNIHKRNALKTDGRAGNTTREKLKPRPDGYEFSLTRTFGPAENQIDFDEFQMQFEITSLKSACCAPRSVPSSLPLSVALIVVLVKEKVRLCRFARCRL